MARVFIGMGSNLGDREARLAEALEALGRIDGCRLAQASRLYETEPVGGPPQGPYLNAVAELDSTLPPLVLLGELLAIESAAGRSRDGARDSPRELDLDLLLYDDQVLETDLLTLPHPRLHLRAFVLEPLAELAGDLLHPKSGVTLAELARGVRDPNGVRPWLSTTQWPRTQQGVRS
ncbi:MAG: 2-amino-4-hydroxy-6-hydroxymethyldihydropteridine diphosphokinase [Deltaproteobacteria bacterium]|nr:2-amino-4-hydroxy-6-hydroxymethyldihydropteridine diphosphokinase [Deltaproteobacteria bacterium]